MGERLCEGRVCVVTGAGRGIGRSHALLLAREGATVVVNDLGGSVAGELSDEDPASDVVAEIRAAGGTAIASHHNVADWNDARALVDLACQEFGQLDVVVNNAGILRDKMLVNMEEADWDAVFAVHAKGTFQVSRWAAAHWRGRSGAGESVNARVVNTTSASGLYGNPGQSNYAAAKAAIAALTIVASQELGRYGVTVNAIAPAAMTRMTEGLAMADRIGAEALAPEWVSPVVAWLASVHSASVTGRVIEVSGQQLAIAEGWSRGPSALPVSDPVAIGEVLTGLVAEARPNANIFGEISHAATEAR